MSGDGAAAGDGGERLAAEARASAEALLDWLGPRLDDARRGGPGRTTDTAPQGPFTQGPFTQGPFTQGPFTQDSSADRPPQSPGPCSWCPVCALVAALRGEQPELTARLADQAAGLVVLVRLLLEGHGSHHHGRASEYPRPTPDPAAPDAPPDVRVRPDPARHRAAEAPTPDATPERPTGRRSPRPSPRLRAVTPDDGPTGSAPPGTPPGRRRPDVQRIPVRRVSPPEPC